MFIYYIIVKLYKVLLFYNTRGNKVFQWRFFKASEVLLFYGQVENVCLSSTTTKKIKTFTAESAY